MYIYISWLGSMWPRLNFEKKKYGPNNKYDFWVKIESV